MLQLLSRLLSLAYLMGHSRVPTTLKMLPIWALLYLIWPRDILFDYRAFPLGFVDDLILALVLIVTFVNKAWPYASAARRSSRKQPKQDAVPVDFKVLDDEDEAAGRQRDATGAGQSRRR